MSQRSPGCRLDTPCPAKSSPSGKQALKLIRSEISPFKIKRGKKSSPPGVKISLFSGLFNYPVDLGEIAQYPLCVLGLGPVSLALWEWRPDGRRDHRQGVDSVGNPRAGARGPGALRPVGTKPATPGTCPGAHISAVSGPSGHHMARGSPGRCAIRVPPQYRERGALMSILDGLGGG